MNQGDALVVALGATMALMLASRALRMRAAQFSLKAKALMALTWVVLIVVGAMIASWWQT